jgi:hypothetical protein
MERIPMSDLNKCSVAQGRIARSNKDRWTVIGPIDERGKSNSAKWICSCDREIDAYRIMDLINNSHLLKVYLAEVGK